VWPAEEYPEYAWAPWNLVSLSGDRHDAMHDRRTGRLTELGEAWRRRIAPPPSEPY
jgi:5-methylcytosine-specific restriction endonuclease McrA